MSTDTPTPRAAGPDTPTPDEVWNLLVHTVIDGRDTWRRAVAERVGMPFSRIRVLKRLDRGGPMTCKDLAHAAAMDAPATTVAVNELETRGLVVREIDPLNRRSKLVSITDAGRAAVANANTAPDPAPEQLQSFTAHELRALAVLLRRLTP